jgi:hypothetical protein
MERPEGLRPVDFKSHLSPRSEGSYCSCRVLFCTLREHGSSCKANRFTTRSPVQCIMCRHFCGQQQRCDERRTECDKRQNPRVDLQVTNLGTERAGFVGRKDSTVHSSSNSHPIPLKGRSSNFNSTHNWATDLAKPFSLIPPFPARLSSPQKSRSSPNTSNCSEISRAPRLVRSSELSMSSCVSGISHSRLTFFPNLASFVTPRRYPSHVS